MFSSCVKGPGLHTLTLPALAMLLLCAVLLSEMRPSVCFRASQLFKFIFSKDSGPASWVVLRCAGLSALLCCWHFLLGVIQHRLVGGENI